MAATITGLMILIITELLSLFALLSFGPLSACWLFATLSALGYLFVAVRGQNLHLEFLGRSLCLTPFRSFLCRSFTEKLMIAGILLITICVGITALHAPPNNWDSMTYHMSRAAHWIQNQSVLPYPTNIPRQINYPPWAEYAIAHFQILSHSDQWANLIQWLSMIGCAMAVSLLARFFKADAGTQILTALITVTIPMGILQGSSTQNDYVLSFWLLNFIILWITSLRRSSWQYTLLAGVSLGLCFLTKGTGYLFAIPFLIFLSGYWGFKRPRRMVIKLSVFVIMISLALNAGYFARNIQTARSLIPASESDIFTSPPNLKWILSNATQNIALHLKTPWKSVNQRTENLFYASQKQLGLLTENGDPIAGIHAFHFPGHPFHEDHAGNFIHLLFILLGLIVFLRSKDKKKNTFFNLYLCALIFTSFIFTAMVQWNLFQSRYHLPLFILWSPFIAIACSSRKRPYTQNIVSVLLFVTCLPWVFCNQSRPLLGDSSIFTTKRIKQYFANRPYLYDPYQKAASYIKEVNAGKLGLSCGEDDWEYPFWVLLDINKTGRRLVHTQVTNASKDLRGPEQGNVELIIDLNNTTGNALSHQNEIYIRTRKHHPVNIFRRRTPSLVKENLRYHFRRMFKLNFLASSLPVTSGNVTKMLSLRKEEFNEANLVDTKELRKIHPDLETYFTQKLLPGLHYRLMGYAAQDRQKRTYGEALISQWNQWVNQNKKIIQILLKK
jgi:4-amino-4-deoxy-L-arabinose transferase-like glycosyltransferase